MCANKREISTQNSTDNSKEKRQNEKYKYEAFIQIVCSKCNENLL